MKLNILLEGLEYQTKLSLDTVIAGITVDSRKIKQGGIFICINGAVADGHSFAEAAIKAGATAVLTERDLGIPQQIITENTHKAFAIVSANWFGRPSEKLKIIGITGTNGKTSTTYAVKHVLEQAGYNVGLIGTIQSMIGSEAVHTERTTPDAYEFNHLLKRMVEAGCEYVVAEVSSHALEQERVGGIQFEVGLFTNLTQDHLDYHKTMENYAAAKKKLFGVSKIGITNMDDSMGMYMLEGQPCKKVTYSVKTDAADYSARSIRLSTKGVIYELLSGYLLGRIRQPIPGYFSVYNSMAAAAICMELGISFFDTVKYMSTMDVVKGRLEVIPLQQDYTVITDYAHTPDGIENAAGSLKELCKGKLIILFGCGGDRDKTKRPLMAKAAAKYGDLLIITSDNPRTEDPLAIIEDITAGLEGDKTPKAVIPSRREAIRYALEKAEANDIVLLAGKGHEDYQILETGTIHFDEREVVREELAKLLER